MKIYNYAKKNKLLSQSAIKDEAFRCFFKYFKVKTVVEIGTHKGISAAYMAGFAKTIFTFDIKDYPEKYKVWEDLGITEKIHYTTIKTREDIKVILDKIKFDTAFIDGRHDYQSVKDDYNLIKTYGNKLILFHDSNKKKFPGSRKFLEEIGAKIIDNIAYWTK